MMKWLAVALACGSVMTPAHCGQAHRQTAAEKAMFGQMGIDASMQVEFQDRTGQDLPFATFMRLVQSGGTFNIRKDSLTHIAVMRIDPVGDAATAPAKPPAGIAAGTRFPEFSLTSLKNEHFSAASLRGHYTLVSLFYSQCAPCIAEVQALNAFMRSRPDVRTLAITFDDSHTAHAFVKKWNLKWTILANAQDLIDRIGVESYPILMLVGPDGALVARVSSSDLSVRGSTVSAAEIRHWVSGNKGAAHASP